MELTHAVLVGLDVGNGEHHATALNPAGKRLHDGALPNDEVRLRQLFDKLAEHRPVLVVVVVDQPASIGALPVAVARSVGASVAYLPGLAMRHLADLHPGAAKTDARDAYVIADAARTLPHTLRRVDSGDAALAELEVLVGYDDDLAAEATRLSNRLRGLLTQVHPALERVLGSRIHHPAVLRCWPGSVGRAACARRDGVACCRWPAAWPPAWASSSSATCSPRSTPRPSWCAAQKRRARTAPTCRVPARHTRPSAARRHRG